MSDTPKDCPKCGEKRSKCAVVDVGMRREWACGTAWSTHSKWQQSPACRIRELEAQIAELQAERHRLYEYAIALESAICMGAGRMAIEHARESTGVDWMAIHTADLTPSSGAGRERRADE